LAAAVVILLICEPSAVTIAMGTAPCKKKAAGYKIAII